MHSKINLAGILLSSILAVTMVVSGAMAVDNIVANPDFEVDTEGWSIGADYGSLSIDGASFVGGGNVLFAQIDSVGANNWEPEIHSPPFDLVTGTTYTYAFWAKTEPGLTRTLGPALEQLETYVSIGEEITVTDEWQEFYYTGEWTHPTSPPQVVIHIGFQTQLGSVWFSHFRVYEGDFVEEAASSVTPVNRLTTAWGQIKSR